MNSTLLFSLSIFDWSGAEFLAFYTVAFGFAVWWSISRRHKYLNSFSPAPGTKPKLEHPVEIAYLAGGGARSAEVAIVSLIEQGSISWESAKSPNNGMLKAIGPLNPECHWLERSLYSEISLRGVAGMPLTSFAPIVNLAGIGLIVVFLTGLDLRRTQGVLTKELREVSFVMLMLFNATVAMALFFVLAMQDVLAWDSVAQALIVAFGYAGLLNSTLFQTDAGEAIGARRYYERMVGSIHDNIRKRQFEKRGPIINYIAYANSR